jgi:prolipoprotein diacylglyceryltransferase
MWFWNRRKAQTPNGTMLGIFLIWVFTLRFFYEYLKEDQVAKEAGMYLNIGQQLSIPAVLIGLYFLIRSYRAPVPKPEADRKTINS